MDDDRPATARKKRGKRKKKDVHKWIANLDTTLDEAADVEATTNSDEAPPTAVASRTHLNEERRTVTVDGAPEKVSREDKAAPKDGALDGAALTTEPDEAAETAVAKITKPLEGSPRTVEAAPEDVVCRCDSPLCSCVGGSTFWVRGYVQNFLGCAGSDPEMKAKFDMHQDLLTCASICHALTDLLLPVAVGTRGEGSVRRWPL